MNLGIIIAEFILLFFFGKATSELLLRKRNPWQFSLNEVLTVVTIVAVLLGALAVFRGR